MVDLARVVYNPRHGELAETLPSPEELCKPDLADRTEVELRLFDAFIPAAYRHDRPGRWKARDAERWFEFLADHPARLRLGPPRLVVLAASSWLRVHP
jgi:hypothetical protein